MPPLLRLLLQIASYPLAMTVGLGGLFYAHAVGSPDLAVAVSIVAVLSAGLVIVLERLIPFEPDWNKNHGDFWADGAYTLITSVVIPETGRALLLGSLVALSGWLARTWGASLWPVNWPVWAQVLLALGLADLSLYWLHRVQHQWPLMWRFHAIHHSAPRLYWLNAGRLHPLDALLTWLCSLPPLIALGCPEPIIALYTGCTAINSVFQHGNVDLRLGPLNWIVSQAQLHRWHHSREISESNTNYGGVLIVWDTLFGTRFDPDDRTPPRDPGIHMRRWPSSFLQQLTAPFRWKTLTETPDDDDPPPPTPSASRDPEKINNKSE